MFGVVRKVLENIMNLNEDELFIELVRVPSITEHIIYLNTFDQLFVGGLNTDGNLIGTYSPVTEALTSGQSFNYQGLTKQKTAGSPYFFYDSGNFIESFTVKIVNGGFVISANDDIDDPLFDTLSQKFGKKLIGLSANSKFELGLKMLPLLNKIIRTKILTR